MASTTFALYWIFVFLFISLCCFDGCVFGLSGGFYADNEKQQSILYKPLATKDKRDIELEILNLLGLENMPKARHHPLDTHGSAPKYLLDLYNKLETDPQTVFTNGSRRALSDSDVIMSFVNRIHHRVPHHRHESNRHFWFDVSEVLLEEEIMAAEFRIFRDHVGKQEDNTIYILHLYAVGEGVHPEDNVLEPVDEVRLTSNDKGWINFNVTGTMIYWTAFPEKNYGLYLRIEKPGSAKVYDPQDVGIHGPKDSEEKEPFMVAYFKAPTQLRIRKTRAAKKKRQENYYDSNARGAWNPYSAYNNVDDTYPSRHNCQRWTLYVSFRDLGWQDWIIAPDGYAAFFCHGKCSFPLNANMNATNHAIVQTLVHLMDPVVPKTVCAPTQLSAITVLYFDDNSNVILKKYKNMVVKSCGCH